MKIFVDIVEIFFSCALFFNAILFIPQAIRIWKVRNSKGLSILTFLGFNIIQLLIFLHGWIMHDYLLMFGYLLSLITCGIVTFSIFYFRKREKN